MAQTAPGKRKPRVRKNAPTIRQKMEAAQAEADKPEPSRRPIKKATRPVRAVFSPIFRFLGKILSPLKRPLKWLVPRYFINSWREVRQVTWPSRRETWRLTAAVFVFAIVFGALVAVVDKGLDEIFKKLILK
jgi:preprotein translocase SecE subunit